METPTAVMTSYLVDDTGNGSKDIDIEPLANGVENLGKQKRTETSAAIIVMPSLE